MSKVLKSFVKVKKPLKSDEKVAKN